VQDIPDALRDEKARRKRDATVSADAQKMRTAPRNKMVKEPGKNK
jgi:hypothetical protein